MLWAIRTVEEIHPTIGSNINWDNEKIKKMLGSESYIIKIHIAKNRLKPVILT